MATYTARHGEWVPVIQNNENNVIEAPAAADAVDGQWFGIKHRSVGAAQWRTIVSGNGALVEDPAGTGIRTEVDIVLPFRCYRWTRIDGHWLLTGAFHPAVHYEPWRYEGADLLIGQNTRINLAYDPIYALEPSYFQAEGDGTIRNIRRYVGYINATLYSALTMTGNNQDAAIIMDINVISGTAQIRQGYGLAASAFSPRAAELYESRSGRWSAIIEPQTVLELRASDDVGQSGLSYAIAETSIAFEVA